MQPPNVRGSQSAMVNQVADNENLRQFNFVLRWTDVEGPNPELQAKHLPDKNYLSQLLNIQAVASCCLNTAQATQSNSCDAVFRIEVCRVFHYQCFKFDSFGLPRHGCMIPVFDAEVHAPWCRTPAWVHGQAPCVWICCKAFPEQPLILPRQPLTC